MPLSARAARRLADRFSRDGCALEIPAIPAATARAAARELAALRPEQTEPAQGPWTQKAYLLFPELAAIARSPTLLDHVEAILGPDLAVLSGDLFRKPAHSHGFISWHQDGERWFLEPFAVLTAWVALTPATLENGCMRYAPGTHHERYGHRETFGESNLLSRGQEVEVAVDEDCAIVAALAPGQASLHHGLLVHASGPNTTGAPRVGFAIRYCSSRCRQVAGPPLSVLPVRGRAPEGLEVETLPAAALSPDAFAAHARALAPHAASHYSTV